MVNNGLNHDKLFANIKAGKNPLYHGIGPLKIDASITISKDNQTLPIRIHAHGRSPGHLRIFSANSDCPPPRGSNGSSVVSAPGFSWQFMGLLMVVVTRDKDICLCTFTYTYTDTYIYIYIYKIPSTTSRGPLSMILEPLEGI